MTTPPLPPHPTHPPAGCLQVAPPDKWKDGAKNTIEGGGRKINENKLLAKSKR